MQVRKDTQCQEIVNLSSRDLHLFSKCRLLAAALLESVAQNFEQCFQCYIWSKMVPSLSRIQQLSVKTDSHDS